MEQIKKVFLVSLGVVMAVLLSGYHSALVPTVAAQMGTDANMTDNNTGGMTGQNMMSKMKGENVTGSINLMSIFSKAIGAQVKVSLSEAATSAESNIGNGSHAVAAHIGQENGFLVYTIKVIDSNMKVHKLIIDPADGKVLLSRELSPMESMMMKLGMMHNDMMNKGKWKEGMMKEKW
jgi:uncharacterized membrane protein YkoI